MNTSALSSLVAMLQETENGSSGSPIALRVGAGVLALVLVGIVILRRKRAAKKEDDEEF